MEAIVTLEALRLALEVRHGRSAEPRPVVGMNAVQECRRRSHLFGRNAERVPDPLGVVDRAVGDVPVVDALVDSAHCEIEALLALAQPLRRLAGSGHVFTSEEQPTVAEPLAGDAEASPV